MTQLSNVDVLILAGGLGRRLNNILKGIPKPMAEIEGKPFLEWILLLLKKSGFKRIILSIGYLGDKIKFYFENGAKWGLNISYVIELVPLGTGGAIRHSLPEITSDPFIALNGDSIVLLDYEKLLYFHFKKKADITICAKEVDNTQRFGEILIDKQDKVVSFREKPNLSTKGWINVGIYVIEKGIFDYMTVDKSFSFEYDILPRFLERDIYAFRTEGKFLDIGTPESFKNANAFIVYLKNWILK